MAAVVVAMASCSGTESPTVESTSATTVPTTTGDMTRASTTTTTSTLPLAVAGQGSLGAGDSRYPELGNGGYDVAHYSIDLTFDPAPNQVSALVEIDAMATEALSAFSLDFLGFDVLEVSVDGESVTYERRGGELIITPTTPLATDQSFVTAIRYEGTPQPIPSQALPFEVGWRTSPDGDAYVIAEPDGARSWLPLNDHPIDKATYTFNITVPEPLVAAANGTLVDRITDLGWSTWVWDSPSPMASYLATVVVGDFEIIADEAATRSSGFAVRNVLPPDLAAAPPPALATQSEMIAFFEQLLGPYPFAAYGIAVVDGFEAALENQTLSIFGRDFVTNSQFFETVLVHELAHQWFGNSVTPADWGDIWLNEGFATYAEWLWVEHTRGNSAYLSTVAGARNQMALAGLAPPGNPPANDLFNASVYVRGGLVLHALRAEVGDEAFFASLATYAAEYRDSNVTTQDFINTAESVSGKELDALFNEWLFSEEVPELPE